MRGNKGESYRRGGLRSRWRDPGRWSRYRDRFLLWRHFLPSYSCLKWLLLSDEDKTRPRGGLIDEFRVLGPWGERRRDCRLNLIRKGLLSIDFY